MRSASTCRRASSRCSTILSAAGYAVSGAPKTPRELLDALSPDADDATLAIEEYERLLARLPSAAVARLHEAWGDPADDADVRDGAFRFRAKKFGKLLVALPPDRGRAAAATRRLSRSAAAAAPCAGRVRPVAATRGEGRCARPHGRARHAGMAARQGGRAHRGMLSGNRHRAAAGDLSVHRQQSGRGGAGQAPHRGGDHRPSAAAARRRRPLRRRARARASGRRICPGRRPRPPPARAAGDADRRDRAAHRPGARGRRRHRVRARRGAAPHRRLAVRSQGPRHQGRPAHLWPRARRHRRSAVANKRRKRSAPRCSPRSTAAASRRGPPARRRAGGATCCRPAAISSPPIRAPCRRRRRWSSAGSPPTRSCARICRPMARCCARWSSIYGAAPRCAPAARRSRKDLR